MRNRLIKRRRNGDFEVHLSSDERDLLRSLTGQLRALLAGDTASDPSVRRLFPAAYTEDPEFDAEYRRLMHDDLLAHRLRCIDTVEETIGLDRLTEAQLLAWMGALNDLRLVLGTRLDVREDEDLLAPETDDPDDPDGPARAVYGWLGWLLEHVVDAANPG